MRNMVNKIFSVLFFALVAIIISMVVVCCNGTASAQKPLKPASLGTGRVYKEATSKGPSLIILDHYRRTLRPFLDAVATVESNNNDKATGDDGKAIGRYQIWSIYWDDAKSFAPAIKGEYSDCRNKEYAERVVVAFLLRYAEDAVKVRDYQTLARIHNGGPRGARKPATLKYWEKVEKIINA